MQLAYSFLSLIMFLISYSYWVNSTPIPTYHKVSNEGEHHLKWNRCQSSTARCEDDIGLIHLTDEELLDELRTLIHGVRNLKGGFS